MTNRGSPDKVAPLSDLGPGHALGRRRLFAMGGEAPALVEAATPVEEIRPRRRVPGRLRRGMEIPAAIHGPGPHLSAMDARARAPKVLGLLSELRDRQSPRRSAHPHRPTRLPAAARRRQ